MKVVRANVPPLQLLESRDRKQFHAVFGNFKTELLNLLGSDREFAGCKKVWVIYLGANINGQMNFVCHVTEDFKTATAYNCEDSTTAECPVLMYVEPLYVPEVLVNAIGAQMPNCLKGKVPVQAAFAISRRAEGAYQPDNLLRLLDRTCIEMETAHFKIKRMTPSGIQSLSFKASGCPLEFWTQPSAPVIFTALELEKKKDTPNPKLISLYDAACQFENTFKTASDAVKALLEPIKKTGAEIEKECTAHYAFLSNNKTIHPDILKIHAGERWTKILELDKSHANLSKELAYAEQEALRASRAIDQFKAEHFENLPHSYREATFQIAFDTTLPDGSVVYKQYNDAIGKFELRLGEVFTQ